MDEENSKSQFFNSNTFLYFLLLIIIGNLFIIDIQLFGQKKEDDNEIKNLQSINIIATPTEIVPSPTDKPSPTVAKQTENSTPATTIKTAGEFYVPLGAGSSTSTEWTDVPGVQAYVNSTLYSNISKVTFEVSLYTPTGNQTASARLFNVTDGHPVWASEVSIAGGSPQLRISDPITLGNGSKLYQVQMKTQIGARTNLENARVHIITE